MKKSYSFSLKIFSLLFVSLLVHNGNAQVGIGTVTPAASSMLDITSTTQGVLTPRMTTAQKIAIASPANGLVVYDTDLKSICYYDLSTTTWITIQGGRNKFKRIKSTDVLATILAAELAAGSGTKYLMDSQTLYEINGQVVFNLPIEINNSYITGLDSGDDKIVKIGGDLFVGSTGGALKVLTVVCAGGRVFNITAANTENLIFRDIVIANSANVGNLSGFGFVFGSIVNFSGNTNGIVYNNINKVLLANQGWFGNNSGTYETFTGTFELIGKQGGFSEVIGASIGIDVSSDPVVSVDASMDAVLFTGTVTTGFYVKRYTTGSYTGYNFNNKWSVNCTGLPLEGDRFALGDFYYNYAVGSGAATTVSGTPAKLAGVSFSDNLYRFSAPANNRLTYLGSKKRFFRATGTVSFQSDTNGLTYIFYIAKNGVVLGKSKIYIKANSTADLLAIPLVVLTEMSPNDYLEVYAEKFGGGSGNVTVAALNLIVF